MGKISAAPIVPMPHQWMDGLLVVLRHCTLGFRLGLGLGIVFIQGSRYIGI